MAQSAVAQQLESPGADSHRGSAGPGRTVVASRQAVSSALDGETVILSLDRGIYFGLDEVGSRVWDLIREPITVDGLCDQLLAHYDVDPDRCRADVDDLLLELERAGLVQVDAAPST